MSLHDNIVRYIHESEYREHQIKIVERKFKGEEPFLYLYILKGNNHDTCLGQYIEDKDLENLEIAIPKIKELIDKDIIRREQWAKEELRKKKEMNWTGQRFNRGDYVYFKGNDKYKAQNSYVWTWFGHLGLEYYLIQHKEGYDRSSWMAKPPFENMDGFECVHSSQLREGLKYIQIDSGREFQGETDELVLLKSAEQIKEEENGMDKNR